MSTLQKRILSVLERSERPLKAREIVNALNRANGHPRVVRSDVNSLLYGRLRRLVVKDGQHRWRLRTQPALHRKSRNASNSARKGFKAQPLPRDAYGDVDKDVRDLFLSLDDDTLRRIFREYRRQHGEKKREYARRTYAKWKSGEVQMSGEICERLLAIVPQFLSFDVRYALIKKLWLNRPARQVTVALNLCSNEDVIRSMIRNAVARNQDAEFPEEMKRHLTWLTNDDAEMSLKLVRAVQSELQQKQLTNLMAEIEGVIHMARQSRRGQRVDSHHTINLPGLTLKVTLWSVTSSAGVHQMTEQNDNQQQSGGMVPSRPDENRELGSVKSPADFLEKALQHVSPEKRQQLVDKAAEETVDLTLEQRRADLDTRRTGESLEDASRVMEEVSRTPHANVSYTDEVKSDNRSTRISIQSRPPVQPQAQRSAQCFVATACFGDTDHPTVVTLRQFRDECLMRFAAGRRFTDWYYRNGPAMAEWIGQRPRLQRLVRAVLRILAGGYAVGRWAGR